MREKWSDIEAGGGTLRRFVPARERRSAVPTSKGRPIGSASGHRLLSRGRRCAVTRRERGSGPAHNLWLRGRACRRRSRSRPLNQRRSIRRAAVSIHKNSPEPNQALVGPTPGAKGSLPLIGRDTHQSCKKERRLRFKQRNRPAFGIVRCIRYKRSFSLVPERAI